MWPEGVAFSPDGSRLVVTTNDGPAAHVWDLRAIRRHLVRMGLDWDAPAYADTDAGAGNANAPLSNIVVDLGPFTADVQPLLKQAEQLEATGQIGPAIERLRQAARMSPDFAEVHNNLAWLLAASRGPLRDPDDALRHARRAVELAPDENLNLNTLGVVLYRTGRFAEAVETLDKSLKAGGGRLAAFDLFFLAMAHHRLNHLEQARDCWKQADRWFEARRKNLPPQYLKELTAFRAEAETILTGPTAEWPDDVFAEPRW
jgi:tetratricopeptide (TPR) repeat protein